MSEIRSTASSPTTVALPQVNRVIRNTYMLLSMVLGVAAVMSILALSMNIGWSLGMWLAFMAVFIGGPFLIHANRSSTAGIAITFAWAAAVGFLLGPLVGVYLRIPGGTTVVSNALVTTALMFFALSGYALASRRDFSFMRGFIFVGLLVVLAAIIANIFLQMPALSLAISAAAVLLMSALILFDTSRMVNGGETNYVTITVSLFANITILFSHLMNLFALFGGDD